MISVDPFALDLDSVVTRALEYTDLAKSIRLEQASPAFVHFLGTKAAHKRGDILDVAKPVVLWEYTLQANPEFDDTDVYHLVCALLDGDSFTNVISSDAQPSDANNADESLHSSQGGSVQDSQKFRHPAIAAVLLAILFDMGFKFGVVFIERLCAHDTEKWWHWERKDKSPEALEGMPIEAIALACTVIQHFLDIQKTQTMGERKAAFEGRHYGIEWGRHMRRLINFSQLGQLRRELLDCVKDRYMRENPYNPDDEDASAQR
ncbi:hypothetical protein FRC11_009780, partial [Ceratobasidium sp. 423]